MSTIISDEIVPALEHQDAAVEPWLGEEVKRYTGGAHAEHTKRAYRSDWSQFTSWCEWRDRCTMPAAPDTVVAYLGYMRDEGKKWATIARRVASLSHAHRLNGYPPPVKHPIVANALQTIRRHIGVGGCRRVKAILPRHLVEWLPLLPDTAMGARDASILTLGLGGAMRRSEIAALTVADVVVTDRGVEVFIARSKTDQFGAGAKVHIWRGSRDLTCPVLRWSAWLRARGDVESDAPAFVAFCRDVMTSRGISGRVVADVVKRLVVQAGMDPSEYAGHSLRAGFVTAADEAGKSDAQIMRQTRHRSRAMLDIYDRPESAWSNNPSEGIGL